MLRRPSESRQMVHRSESSDHAVAWAKRTSSLAVAIPKMQKERPDEWGHLRLEIGRIANNVNVGKFRQGLAFEMIENARAHVRRRLAESKYLDERDSRRREHKEPGISCNIVKAEAGLFRNLSPNVAIEIDTAMDDIFRVEHAGGKVNAAGTGSMGIHHAQHKRAIAG